jgi:UDP-N-acetylglucosamine transferase subunit ALG13
VIKEMDEIAGRIDEEVVMQIGETAYEPKNTRYFRFTSNEEIDRLYEDARVVVCHAGVGSILSALGHSKPVIAVPRGKKYGEHVDDHQLEIARELEMEGEIMAVYDIEELEKALNNPSVFSHMEIKNDEWRIMALKNYLEELDAKD